MIIHVLVGQETQLDEIVLIKDPQPSFDLQVLRCKEQVLQTRVTIHRELCEILDYCLN